MKCRYCGSRRVIKKSWRKNLTGNTGSARIAGDTLQGENCI